VITSLLNQWSPVINGLIGAYLAVFLIPRFMRAKHTGEYIGFSESALIYLLLGWGSLKAVSILAEFGWSIEGGLRVLVSTSIPFLFAWIWVKLTDFFGWDKSLQTRS